MTNNEDRCKILPGGQYKFMLYKIRKMSEGVSIRAKYESGESIDRLEFARFSNANLSSFINDTDIRGRWVVAQTTWEVTLSEYLENSLNFKAIILLLRQCIDFVDDIIKNNFLLMYVDFDLEHVWVSNFGTLQFLYLPAEEERQTSGFINFFERVISGIKASESLDKEILREIIHKVERMPFFSSRKVRAIIDSAEKEYEEVLAKRQNEKVEGEKKRAKEAKEKANEGQHGVGEESNSKLNKEAPVGTSSVGPYIYNLSTGEIIMYNPGDLIVFSDRNLLDRELLDKDISCHFGRNIESH